MDIRNSLEGLKTLLGVTPSHTPQTPLRATTGAAPGGGLAGSDQATFSSAGSQAAQAVSEPEVRLDKVAAIQSALAAGTYNISPAAVASKLVGAMLGASQ